MKLNTLVCMATEPPLIHEEAFLVPEYWHTQMDLDKCVPEFMQVLSTTDYFRNQVKKKKKTATMTTIGQDGILKTEIILPPLEMQQRFLAFVEQANKSKLSVQQSIDQLETLKKSLMQKYFG